MVVLSSPLHGRHSRVFDKMLSGMADLAPSFVRKLMERFINATVCPPDIYEPGNDKVGNGSLVLSLASGLWNILTFGYSNVVVSPPSSHGMADFNIDEELWSKKPLADLSVLLVLLLINHSSSITESNPEDHCFRLALYRCYSHKGINSSGFLCLGNYLLFFHFRKRESR